MKSEYGIGIVIGLVAVVGLGYSVHAQVPQKGTAATFDVATWNIQFFGFDGSSGPSDEVRQFQNVLTVMRSADIDLWAVQEMGDETCFPSIVDRSCFQTLVDSLDGYNGVRGWEIGPLGYLHLGFIYKTDVIMQPSAVHVLRESTAHVEAFGDRPPLLLEADVTIGSHTEHIYFIVVHMVASQGGRLTNPVIHARHEEASRLLRDYIDTHLSDQKVMVLGDFNDHLTRGRDGGPSPYADWVADTTRYRFLSLPLEERGETTISSFFNDQIAVTNELYPAYVEESAAVFSELEEHVDRYTTTTSDHLPVLARFDLTISTGTQLEELPAAGALLTAYPNPFHDRATLTVQAARPGPVRVEVVDVLGRRMAVVFDGPLPPGPQRLMINAGDWPDGIYFVRLHTASGTQVRQLVRVR